MRVFIYEFVSGGGWWNIDAASAPTGSLLAEGRAMVRAIAGDFCGLPATQVVVLQDCRLERFHDSKVAIRSVRNQDEERRAFEEVARASDYSIVIAPEMNGFLLERTRWAEQLGARLLSPDSRFVELASDKHATATVLALRGVKVPEGSLWQLGTEWPTNVTFPAVAKRNDGAGSTEIWKLSELNDLSKCRSAVPLRVEEFCGGMAASVGVLSGSGGTFVLPGGRQVLSNDGCFQYLGGELPLSQALCRRTTAIAQAVEKCLPRTTGFFGIDLILGDRADGASDTVIEVNPRLTTSYVGWRAIARFNLAAAMLDVAEGRAVELSFSKGAVRFDAAGSVEIADEREIDEL